MNRLHFRGCGAVLLVVLASGCGGERVSTSRPSVDASGESPAAAAAARPPTADELQTELNRAVRELELTRARLSQAQRAEADALARAAAAERAAQSAAAAGRDAGASQAQIAELSAQVKSLQAANAALVAAMEADAARPLTRPAPPSALPAELDAALRAFATRYAGRVQYDATHGGLSFANDRLFAPGSDAVRSDAQELLAAFARVAASAAPSEFDVVVVGHADSAPISPGSRSGRGTNWHLSVDRAIAVKDALLAAGLPETRIAVMGYGAMRPAGRDRSRDRRVEIFIARRGEVRGFVLPAQARAN